MQYIIAYDGYSLSEINEIAQIVKSDNIKIKPLIQLEFEASALTIIITIILTKLADSIITGIGNSIGQDIWKKLKVWLSSKNRSKEFAIGLILQTNTQKIQLNIKGNDPKTIEKALDTVDNAIQKIKPNEANISFFFDSKTQQWDYIRKQGFKRLMTFRVADTNILTQKNRQLSFTKESLEESVKHNIGLPVTLEHGGKQIGEITKAWVDKETLYQEIGIYNDVTTDDEKQMEEILQSGGGISIGFTYNQSNNPQRDDSQ